MINNFFYRIGQFLHDNRARVVRFLLYGAAGMLVLAALNYGIQTWQRGKYEQKINALEAQWLSAEARANEMERQAETLKEALSAKYAQAEAIRQRAETAETNLKNVRRTVQPLKEEYDQTRLTPIPADPVSCADACQQLAAIGYPCN